MNNKTNRISSIPRTFGMALLGLALSTGAALAADRPSFEPAPESLGPEKFRSENLRSGSGAVAPLHLAFENLGIGAYAVDAWWINCPAGTHHVAFDVKDYSAAGPTLGIAAVDYSSGYSAMTRANQGAIALLQSSKPMGSGWYSLHIFKTGGAVGSSATYDSIQVCHTAAHGVLGDLYHAIFQDE